MAKLRNREMSCLLTFLVVDGDSRSRFLIRAELAARFGGCQVIEAGAVEEAMVQIKERKPNAVLTDQRLPPLEGSILIRGLRAMDYQGPILMLTGNRDPAVRQHALASGADGVFFNWESEYLNYLSHALGNRP
jgi:DNA-binding response OmpR family regulator